MRFIPVLLLSALVSGCTMPLGPSGPPRPVYGLTVLVYDRGDQVTPLRASVVLSDGQQATTNGEGSAHFLVAGEVTATASAQGYRAFSATAELRSDERWTFFLERQ